MLINTLKVAAGAGLLALGLAAASSPAQAYTMERCNDNGCYRVRCDDDGYNCTRISSYYGSSYYVRRTYTTPMYDRPYYHAAGRYLCDTDGDECRWTHYYMDSDY
jgi:hypothetical protein